MEMDEGALTAAVIAPYAAEDGKRGQAAAEAVLPLRRALWRAAETYAPARLAACLRVRARATDQTGRGGVRELRQALADWLDPPPTCKRCRRVIVAGSDKVGCSARASVSGRRLACLPDRRPGAVRAGREARCGTLALFAPTLADPHVAEAWAKFSGAADVVCDRDGRALLAATAPRGARLPAEFAEALAALAASMHPEPDLGPPAQVLAARRRFERAVDDAIRANGRLILATQVKYYKAAGATMRADLVQGAAMGLRRALMDYDASAVHKNGMTARIASYSIPWIRQGAGEAYAERDLLGTPDWVGALRRKVEAAGLAPADLLRAALHLAEAACSPSLGLGDQYVAARELTVLVLDPATTDATLLDSALAVLTIATPPAPKASKQTAAAPPTKQEREKQEERSAERILAWAAGILEVEATGSGLLAALRHGAPVYVSTLATGADDDDSDDGAQGRGPNIKDSRRVNALSSGEHEDIEATIAEEEDAALKWRRASDALTDLRKQDPEAAEVIRRRRGLDGLGEEEALESIASTGLTCTGRAPCRESVRQLQKRGEAVLRRRATASVTP
jgi:hypothetical protein